MDEKDRILLSAFASAFDQHETSYFNDIESINDEDYVPQVKLLCNLFVARFIFRSQNDNKTSCILLQNSIHS